MKMPKPSEADKEWFKALVPDDPRAEVKPIFGNLGAFVNGSMFMGLFGAQVGLARRGSRRCRRSRRNSRPAVNRPPQRSEPWNEMLPPESSTVQARMNRKSPRSSAEVGGSVTSTSLHHRLVTGVARATVPSTSTARGADLHLADVARVLACTSRRTHRGARWPTAHSRSGSTRS